MRHGICGMVRSRPHNCPPTFSGGGGFTFVELLVVCLILGIISLAIYSTFASGIRIWRQVSISSRDEDVDIFLDRFGNDIRNMFAFEGLDFVGARDRVVFPTLIKSARFGTTVGQVIYKYDVSNDSFIRTQRDFTDVYRDDVGSRTHSLENVESLLFRYYFYDAQVKKYIWLGEWKDEGSLPLAVGVEIVLDDGEHTETYTKTASVYSFGKTKR